MIDRLNEAEKIIKDNIKNIKIYKGFMCMWKYAKIYGNMPGLVTIWSQSRELWNPVQTSIPT